MSEGLPAETKKLLRSLLISAEHGVALKDLQKDFYDTVGYQLPYKRLGYNDVEDMLCDIPDTVRVSRDCTGQIRLFGVANQDTAHIADMIKKQKKGSFNPYKAPPKAQGIPQRGRRGGSRYNNSFNAPRQNRVSSQFSRSQTLPPNNKQFEYDTFSSSSYSNNRYQQGYNNYRGGGGGGTPSYGRPPQSYSSGSHPIPSYVSSYDRSYDRPYDRSYDRPSTQSYNYQDKPQKYTTTLNHNRSVPVSETLSPNKNSHILHGAKEAIYDLLVAAPEGIPGMKLEDEYYKIFRQKLPYYSLGYHNSKEFIESIPDIVKIDKIDGGPTMCYLADRRVRAIKENNSHTEWPDHKNITSESLSPLDSKGKQVTSHDNNGITADFNDEIESEFILTEDEKKRHLNELKSNVYKFLYNKGTSVPIDEFEHQYRAINREDPEIPYRLLGYPTLKDFLSSILDIVIIIQDNRDGNCSVVLKNHSASPPSPIVPPRYPVHVNNQPTRSRMPPMPSSNMIRPYATGPLYPNYRSPYPTSGFMPPGPLVHQIRPQRLPPPNSNARYPLSLSQPHLIPPPISEPLRPTNSRDPPGFNDLLSSPNAPPPLVSPIERMTSEFASSLSIDEIPFSRPHGITTTKINSLSMDFDKAQNEFIQTIIMNITEVRKEIRLKVSSSLALRFLTGNNVVVLAAENHGKCVCLAISLVLDLDVIRDNLQSLVICNDSNGVDKMFECLKIASYNTGVKVSSYPSADNFVGFEPASQVIVIVYPLLERLLNSHNISQLTRIGVYNLIVPPVPPFQFNTVIDCLKQYQGTKLPSDVRYFFATNPHNDAGSFILRMVNVLMRSKCMFTYYGSCQDSDLTLIPHDTNTTQVLSYEAHLRPNVLASITRWSRLPNRFDKYLIPLAASGNNFTILSELSMEDVFLRSLALLALIKIEPSTLVPQVVIVVPNEQLAKDLLELCNDMGRLDGIMSCIITDKSKREDTRNTQICIGCTPEIAFFSKNTFSFTKISLVIVFKIDLEANMHYLADLFQSCQSPQVIVVGAGYTRQILNIESKYMSEPRHITFLAEETY